MARLPRICPPGIPQHIVQRGNNRQVCFASVDDFTAYAGWLCMASEKHNVAIHAWVFMTNHVHILATPHAHNAVSHMMQEVGRLYVRYFNKTYKRTGTLWEGRFKSCVIEADRYLLSCQRYIELNPVRANLVDDPSDYHWSSYGANGLGRESKYWTPHETYLGLGNSDEERQLVYRDLFKAHIDEMLQNSIRGSVNKGLALGDDKFKDEIERLTGRRVIQLKPGPKKRIKQEEPDASMEQLLL